MAKAALLDVLRQTIGKYVKNLDPEKLNVAIWSGKIELNSLELDVESINSMLDQKAEEAPNLAMPFKVVSGHFESFQVDVPWSKISSSPVILRARGLNVVVEPLDRSSSQFFHEDDEIVHDDIRNMKRVAKQKELREQLIAEKDTYRIQAYNLAKIALAAENDDAKDSSTFASRIGRRIMENIQIQISNVHISLNNDDGAAGVVLESLKLMTTDKHGNKVYVDRTMASAGGSSISKEEMAFQHKMLQIEGFGVYLDEDEFVSARKSLQSISEDGMSLPSMRSVTSDNSSMIYSRRSLGHSYVLAPLSFEARLRIAENSCVDNAKYELTSNLSVLSFVLKKSQVEIVRKVAKIMSPPSTGPTPLFPEYRPIVLVKGNAKEWWHYAGRCIGRMSGRRLWVEFFLAYKKRKKYIPLFKRHSHSAECPWVKPLTKEELQELLAIEQDRTISMEGLMAWRTLADAQIDKEKEKRKSAVVQQQQATASGSYFSYIFGSKPAATPESAELQPEEEPAIVLSIEEMKELEEIAKFDVADNGMAPGAKYYDLKFVLDAMKIDLVGYDSNHLALLDMGKVAVEFDANADGAFTTSFDLYDLQIFDRVTPNSIFPAVLKKIENEAGDKTSTALHLDLSMSSSGDSSLKVKMAEFRLVGSKLMAQELKLFFEDSSKKVSSTKPKANPMLRKSLSGSVDLFYDAKQGESLPTIEVPTQAENTKKGMSSDEVKDLLSNTLVDVWKKKSQEKVSWLVDIDIRAPIVLIPEACNSVEANVLVFDLGNFELKYEKDDPSDLLQQWFNEYPRESLKEDKFETGTISVSDLTFSVQKASYWHPMYANNEMEGAIIDPIGVSIDFAVEDIGPDFDPRSCFLGVIPTISLKLSHVQASQILEVVESWTDMFGDPGGQSDPLEDIQPLLSPSARVNENAVSDIPNNKLSKEVASGANDHESDASTEESYPLLFCRIGLQRLSVTIMDEGKKQLEAHLVSVYASLLQNSDESSVIKLTMGWFWILDWIERDYARRQRLLMHSNLPISAEAFARRNEYNVIEELTKEGVFERDYSGSTELADVSYKTFSKSGISLSAKDIAKYKISEDAIKSNRIRTILDAKFRSLVMHWNPHAIKEINALSGRFLDILTNDNETGALISSPVDAQYSAPTEASNKISDEQDAESADLMLIMAEMESLGIILNSARDDLPLYTLTVSDTRVALVPNLTGQEISLSLGDLRIATPENLGKTLPEYRTLLGLEHGTSGSLLTVKYFEGRQSIEGLNIELEQKEEYEAVAFVELSPMRFCYIQSQVMTLVGYMTDGILGALTAQTAISAAEAAKDFANSVSAHSYFSIRATSFEIIVPEAAYRDEQIRLKTASLDVDYYMYSDTRGSDIRVTLSDLMMKGHHDKDLQEAPIHLSTTVKMPMVGIGSLDDQAMRVNAGISEAKFVLTKDQYSQIMNTLEKNISETAMFLREDDLSGQIVTSAKDTHTGVQLDESTQRLYFILDIKEVSLELNGRDREDPLVRLTATETTISMDMIPDLEVFAVKALLQNLVCEDCRLVALGRQSRFLMDQCEFVDKVENKDLFQIDYRQEKATTDIDLTLGSPQVVLIPDLISEVLLFVGGTESEQQGTPQPQTRLTETGNSVLHEQVVQVDSIGGDEIIETNLRSSDTSVTKISAKTGTCRFVLMDLGSQSCIDGDTRNTVETFDTRPELTETVVLQGIFSGSLSTESSADDKLLAANFQLNSDAMEIFTAFGKEMKSPLQIMEPASGSIYGSLKSTVAGDTEIEVRAAALTPLAISFSMHNAALIMAIVDSVNESLVYTEDKESAEADTKPSSLTPEEQERIERLATALEEIDHNESVSYSEGGNSFAESRASSSQNLSTLDSTTTTKIQIKLTMPKATISFINDLQGIDEALFRISVTNFVAGGNMLSPATLFEFHCNTSILADYFDSSVNLWSRLLIKPWEITMKGGRSQTHRFKSKRLSSTFDLESFPCWISFSEQFLVSLASAARMWSIYSAASSGALNENFEDKSAVERKRISARSIDLITSFPHAISNHSGIDVSFSLESASIKDRQCQTKCTQYFRFEPPKGSGYGGTRVYGQDVEVPKVVEIKAEGSTILVNMDLQLGQPASAHVIGDSHILYTRVVKEGKTKVLHLRSHVEVINRTLIPFRIEFIDNDEAFDVGECRAKNSQRASTILSTMDGVKQQTATNFSIPIPRLENFEKEWKKFGKGKITLRLNPLTQLIERSGEAIELWGEVSVPISLQEMRRAPYGRIQSKVEVTCRKKEQLDRGVHPLTLNVVFTMQLLRGGEHVIIDASLEPRSIIENKMPLAMKIRTLMPQTFSTCEKEMNEEHNETTYLINPNDRVEIFTPGPSIAITTRTRDNPVAGHNLGWLDGGWVDLPLMREFSLPDPIISMLPLDVNQSLAVERDSPRGLGAEFFIVEGKERLGAIADMDSQKSKTDSSKISAKPNHAGSKKENITEEQLAFILTVRNYGVDHTGSILFEQGSINDGISPPWQSNRSARASETEKGGKSRLLNEFSDARNSLKAKRIRGQIPLPLGAFSSPVHGRRISLLPNAQLAIRLLQMTIEGTEGFRRTMPFMIEQLPIGDGGAATIPIMWENKQQSGLFAYRQLVNGYQSEVHVVPEFIVFNGSENTILVQEKMMPEVIIESGAVGQLRAIARPKGLQLSVNFIELGCHTAPLSVAKLGLKVAIVKSNDGSAVGSVYIQTVIDTRGDSRLVVKVGEVKLGPNLSPITKEKGLFDADFCRFRIRWTELQLVLNEAGQRDHDSWNVKSIRNQKNAAPTINTSGALLPSTTNANRLKLEAQNQPEGGKVQILKQPIMALIFSRFTVDFQRVFKDGEKDKRVPGASSLQRSQISVIVHKMQIKDLTPNSHYPMVFDCNSDCNVFDLCIRLRGSLNADLLKVDLFDLNLAHQNGKSEKMILTTSEDYVWRILDLVNRILAASGEVSGFTLKYENDENDNYVLKIEDAGKTQSNLSEKNQYTAPSVDTLYDIALARVSPFTLVVSFRRNPELARYQKVQNSPGAAVTNYFTRKLKFTIDKAELKFSRFRDRTLKGPMDRLIEALTTVYIGQLKFKVVSLLSAASVQDWRFLAARDDGNDEYVEGDILRATGNLAGKSAALVVKSVGRGVGGAFVGVSSFVGEGIEHGTSKIGARRVGTGVSSVVTGIGHGVGSTVSGVGTGAGKIIQGAGQGVGHVFGGVSGGALQIGKGIGKGIATGDGRAVVDGITKGASSFGNGIAQGAESAVMGTADGLLSVGKGIFSGVKSVGRGVGGAIRGKKPSQFDRKKKPDEQK